jgi:hypothetical protein
MGSLSLVRGICFGMMLIGIMLTVKGGYKISKYFTGDVKWDNSNFTYLVGGITLSIVFLGIRQGIS